MKFLGRQAGRPGRGDRRDSGEAEATVTPPEREEDAAASTWSKGDHGHDSGRGGGEDGGRCGHDKVSPELHGRSRGGREAPARPYCTAAGQWMAVAHREEEDACGIEKIFIA